MTLARPRLRRTGETIEGATASDPPWNEVTPAHGKQMPAYSSRQATVIAVPLHQAAPARTPPPDAVPELAEEETTQASHALEGTQKPDISGTGEELHSTGHSITLQGRTD